MRGIIFEHYCEEYSLGFVKQQTIYTNTGMPMTKW